MRSSLTISLVVGQFFCTICLGQSGELDSLKRMLPTLHDSARIPCITKIWVHYMHGNSNRDSAVFYSNLCYEESKKINYVHGIAQSFTQKAFIALNLDGDFSRAHQLAEEALKWYDLSSNKENIGYARGALFRAINKNPNTDSALAELKRLYRQGETKNDIHFMRDCLESMTDIYRDWGQYDKLVDAQEKLMQMDNLPADKEEYTIHQLWVIGLIYTLLEEYPTALLFWRKLFLSPGNSDFMKSWGVANLTDYAQVLTLSNQADSALYYYNLFDSTQVTKLDLAVFRVSKGEYYFFQKDYRSALSLFEKALGALRQFKDQRKTKRALLDIARTYTALHACDSAVAYAREGLTLALQLKSSPSIRDAYQILSTAYDQTHRSDSANFYFKSYIAAKDSVLGNQTRGRLATYNYQQKIVALNKEKSLQQQQLQQEKNTRNILFGTLIFGLVLAGSVIRNIQLKRKKDRLQHLMTEANTQLETRRREQQLTEMQQQKTELEMQSLRAQMNPHFIFNSLNSINMFILENNKLQASEYLSKFSRLVRLILQNSQESFIPLERELEALQLYLELESLRFDNKFEHKISVETGIDTTVMKVPPLVIQPYAENAIWHGLMHKKDKGHLEIALYLEERVLFCKITDDGIGRKRATEMTGKIAQGQRSMGMRITAARIAMAQQNTQADMNVRIRDLVMADGSAGGTEVLFVIPAIE